MTEEYLKEQIESGHRTPFSILNSVLSHVGQSYDDDVQRKSNFFRLLKDNYSNSLLKNFWIDQAERKKSAPCGFSEPKKERKTRKQRNNQKR